MNGNKMLFGYRNAAYYNQRYEGDLSLFTSRKERDEAIERLRRQAIAQGLSKSAAQSGIWPVKLTLSEARRQGYSLPYECDY